MKEYRLPENVLLALASYLKQRPWAEVHALLQSLGQCPVIEKEEKETEQ